MEKSIIELKEKIKFFLPAACIEKGNDIGDEIALRWRQTILLSKARGRASLDFVIDHPYDLRI